MEGINLLNARQAADRLGIKLDTLYAYVSRGRLQSVSLPGSRERRYRVEDVEALLATREGEKPVRSTESEALMPVFGSSICLIENGRLFYRGKDAIRLSEEATLEEVATLLWRERCRARGIVISARTFALTGLAGVPLVLLAAWAALLVTG